jgi:hypothetical protein
MIIEISQINIQLFFKEPVFQDMSILGRTLLGYGFTHKLRKSEHIGESTPVFFKDGFRVSVATSNALPNRILQIVSFPNSVAEPDQAARRFLSMIGDILLKDLRISTKTDLDACRVVFHTIVRTEKDVPSLLRKIEDLSSISALDSYAVHKNPFKALQLTQKIGSRLEHEDWQDIRISSFNTNAYVVTIFHESMGIMYLIGFLSGAKSFVERLMSEIERSVPQN